MGVLGSRRIITSFLASDAAVDSSSILAGVRNALVSSGMIVVLIQNNLLVLAFEIGSVHSLKKYCSFVKTLGSQLELVCLDLVSWFLVSRLFDFQRWPKFLDLKVP